MKLILIGYIRRTIYTIYSLYPVFIIINLFRYFGRDYSLNSFIFTTSLGVGVRIMGGVMIDSKSKIGDYSYISGDEFRVSGSKIQNTVIGKYCSIGFNFNTLPYSHNYKNISTYPFSNFANIGDDSLHKPIVIQNDVWIGANVTVLGGVTIHNGAVVGAGSIVTEDVPAYAIVVGTPAVVKKMRFNERIVNKLLSIEWWERDHHIVEKIMNNYKKDDVEQIIEQFLKG